MFPNPEMLSKPHYQIGGSVGFSMVGVGLAV